jgi:hypothetical protein
MVEVCIEHRVSSPVRNALLPSVLPSKLSEDSDVERRLLEQKGRLPQHVRRIHDPLLEANDQG